MDLFTQAIDYSKDIFRNIRTIKITQDLFDDLSEDYLDWEAANLIEMYTHIPLIQSSVIQRPFDYSKNDFIDYPFDNITASRYNDGSVTCWYGSETLETTIYETLHHFISEIQTAWEVFKQEKTVKIDRRVAQIYCQGLTFDLSNKVKDFPWLVDPLNYSKCQEIGRRVAKEGHPLLRVPSARHDTGINVVAFNPLVLSNARDYCHLTYIFNVSDKKMKVLRGTDELHLENV